MLKTKLCPQSESSRPTSTPPHAKIPYRSCRHVKWQNKSPTPAPVQLLSQRDIITGGTYSRVRWFYPYIIIQLLPWTADQTRPDQISLALESFGLTINLTQLKIQKLYCRGVLRMVKGVWEWNWFLLLIQLHSINVQVLLLLFFNDSTTKRSDWTDNTSTLRHVYTRTFSA